MKSEKQVKKSIQDISEVTNHLGTRDEFYRGYIEALKWVIES